VNFLGIASLFAPEWLTPWFAVAAIISLLFGFRRMAAVLAIWPMVDWILVPMVQPVIDRLPLLWLIGLLALIGLFSIRIIFEFLIGEEGAGNVLGTYTVRAIDFLVLFPIRLLQGLGRLL